MRNIPSNVVSLTAATALLASLAACDRDSPKKDAPPAATTATGATAAAAATSAPAPATATATTAQPAAQPAAKPAAPAPSGHAHPPGQGH